MKTCGVLMAMAVCLQAAGRPVCPIGDFYPATDPRGGIGSAVAQHQPEVIHEDERPWFDFIALGFGAPPGDRGRYEVTVLRNGKGEFRVSLFRLGVVSDDDVRGPDLVDSRGLPTPVAERLHSGLIPILARTHYEPAMVQWEARLICMGGDPMFATVGEIDRGFDRLSGEAWTGGAEKTDTDVGSVQALGRALRNYTLRRIDADGLEEPIERVEARARPGEAPMSTPR